MLTFPGIFVYKLHSVQESLRDLHKISSAALRLNHVMAYDTSQVCSSATNGSIAASRGCSVPVLMVCCFATLTQVRAQAV